MEEEQDEQKRPHLTGTDGAWARLTFNPFFWILWATPHHSSLSLTAGPLKWESVKLATYSFCNPRSNDTPSFPLPELVNPRGTYLTASKTLSLAHGVLTSLGNTPASSSPYIHFALHTEVARQEDFPRRIQTFIS